MTAGDGGMPTSAAGIETGMAHNPEVAGGIGARSFCATLALRAPKSYRLQSSPLEHIPR